MKNIAWLSFFAAVSVAFADAKTPEFCKRGSTVLFQGDSITDGYHFGDRNLVRMTLWDKFVGPDGEIPRGLMFDMLHPTAAGYDIWGTALKRVLP